MKNTFSFAELRIIKNALYLNTNAEYMKETGMSKEFEAVYEKVKQLCSEPKVMK